MKLSLLALLTCLPLLALAHPTTSGSHGAEVHQGPWHGSFDPEQKFDYLNGMLQLTPSQREEIKSILEAEFGKKKSIYDDSSLSDEQKHQALETLQQDADKQIEGVLTPDQVAKFEQMRQGGQGSPQGPMDAQTVLEHLTQTLDLTASQQEKIKSILETQFAQKKSIFDDTSLSQDQKHQEVEAVQQDMEKQIKAVLRQDQAQKFEQMFPHHN